MAQRGSKDTKTTHEGFKITRKKDAHRLATRVSCQTSVPSGFNTAMKQCNALIRNIGQTKTRSTNPESIVFSRDPAYLQRHNRSLQESHKIRFGGGGVTKPKARGKEMLGPQNSGGPSISLYGNARTTNFCVRKTSFPQEISCAFKGTLDLYGSI